MTTEQKAKAYDRAIEMAKSFELPEYKNIMVSLFPELKRSDDEHTMKDLLNFLKSPFITDNICDWKVAPWISWLEKQGEHKKFRDSIQVGDEVTRNSDGVIVNLSQLKRVAKKSEQKLPIEKLPEEMKTIGESLGFTTQKECDEYNKMVSGLIMSDDNKEEQKQNVDNKKLTDVNHEYFSELLENDDSKDINYYAYQVAYCMSHDWLEETATWEDVQKAVKLGAQWQKQQLIDKACEWINLHIGELSDIYTRSAIRNEFLEDFRKAMEERL